MIRSATLALALFGFTQVCCGQTTPQDWVGTHQLNQQFFQIYGPGDERPMQGGASSKRVEIALGLQPDELVFTYEETGGRVHALLIDRPASRRPGYVTDGDVLRRVRSEHLHGGRKVRPGLKVGKLGRGGRREARHGYENDQAAHRGWPSEGGAQPNMAPLDTRRHVGQRRTLPRVVGGGSLGVELSTHTSPWPTRRALSFTDE